MTTPFEALEALLAAVEPGAVETMPLAGAAGHFAAAGLASRMAVPPFITTALDGFALRAADVAGVTADQPVRLRIAQRIHAGSAPTGPLGAGEAAEVMTGAPIPPAADAILRVEDSRVEDGDVLVVQQPLAAGTGIRAAGGDSKPGDPVLAPGDELTPARLGLLASCGEDRVQAHRRPRVALLVSGDEIVTPTAGAALEPGQIFDAITPMLTALLDGWGVATVQLGPAPDEPAALEGLLERGLGHDILVTTGGVSMGSRDFLRPALRNLGCTEIFWRVSQQPGGPLLAARRGGTLVVALPGNPVSAFVCADLYLRAVIAKVMGAPHCQFPIMEATLGVHIRKGSAKTAFLRACLEPGEPRPVAMLNGAQDSNSIRSLVGFDGYIVFPSHVTELRAGDTVEFLHRGGGNALLPAALPLGLARGHGFRKDW